MTNREYMINLLLDGLEEDGNTLERVSFDDCGASEESMVYYNIKSIVKPVWNASRNGWISR